MGGLSSSLASASLLAAALLSGGGAASAPAPATVPAPALPASIAAAVGSRTEAEAASALEAVDLPDLRRLPFEEVERLVRLSWWRAAQALIARSHQAKLDLTAPVRRATSEVKREADLLLKWLDPRFANPEPTPMATRWAQNTTATMLAARFAPRWDAPGANLAVFSTERGKGHVDRQRTSGKIASLLRVNISDSRVEAEITAEQGSVRKRYTLSLDLFDEVVPEMSSWDIEFHRAQGSMQMSSGAQIPELQILLRKRWPGTRRWPRLASESEEEAEGSPSPAWWADAPGLSEKDTAALRESPARAETPLTCSRAGGLLFCAARDACLPACAGGGGCPGAERAHSGGRRCVAPPRPTDPSCSENCSSPVASFFDEDLDHGTVGGVVRWSADPEASVETFSIYWAAQEEAGPLPGAPPLAAAVPGHHVEPEPSFPVSNGTAPPPGATSILIFASNEAGQALWARAAAEDRARPSPPMGLRFTDTDARRWFAGGVAQVDVAAGNEHVQGYELRWGSPGAGGSDGPPEVRDADGPPVAEAPAPPASGSGGGGGGGGGGGSVVHVALPDSGVPVPKDASLLLVLAVGLGGARSLPVAVSFTDAAPPTVPAARLDVGADTNRAAGVASLELTVHPGSCDATAQQSKKGAARKRAGPCDAGDAFAIYWLDKGGRRISKTIATAAPGAGAAPGGPIALALEAVEVPRGAASLTAVAYNVHGEMSMGVTAEFLDDRSDSYVAWRTSKAVVACTSGEVGLWGPLGAAGGAPSEAINANALRIRGVLAVSLSSDGEKMLLGQEDGGVSLLSRQDSQWQVLNTVAGPGAVTALSFEGDELRMLRGSRHGQLDAWRLSDGICTAHLRGHVGEVRGMDVDWGRNLAASASQDGTVRVWDLSDGTCTRTISVPEVEHVAVDWAAGRLLTAAADETLRLFDLGSGEQLSLLEGHSEPVKHLRADFAAARALSVSSEGSAKLWDLTSRECLLTFGGASLVSAVAVSVRWSMMQALFLLADGSTSLWDLQDGSAQHDPEPRAYQRSYQPCTVRAGSLT